MANLIPNFLLALTFFSRIPLPATMGKQISHDSKLTDAVAFFPIAGFIIALAPASVWFLSGLLLPAVLSAALAITVGLLVTGALHEDGLADCADGLGATSNREKALEIMRDSRIGTYGALALIASFCMRWAGLSNLPIYDGILALLIAHSASRSAMTIAMRFSTYARTDGLGKMASGELSELSFLLSLALPCVFAVYFAGLAGLLAVVAGLFVSWLLLKYLDSRLGGYTGDGLGAMQQVCEIAILITLAGFWA